MSNDEPRSGPQKIDRRRFVKRMAIGGGALAVGGLGYGLAEAGWIAIQRTTISVPRLPQPFAGTTVAFLSDIHHGPFTGIDYIHAVMQRTDALAPDLILLGGDYVHRGSEFIKPCMEAHRVLDAPLGVYGVLGNHDHWHGADETRVLMTDNGITDLTNQGVWLKKDGARLRLGGVGDLWEDKQDLGRALDDAQLSDACLLLSHNPDFAETLQDRRVGLMLSGHTHGGQIVFPGLGAPKVPSRFGQKYLRGLIAAPNTQVYVSRGLGTVTPPLRFGCRPEIALITLA